MNTNVKRITLLALWIALSVVLGNFKIVTPATKGFITILDAGIYSAAFLLGKKEGAVVGGLSAFLLDLLSGYPNYMFFSLLIHGGQGFLAGLFKNKIIAFISSMLLMVVGYFIVGGFMYGFGAAIVDLPTNIIQCAVGFVAALIISPIIEKTGLLHGFKQA